MRFVGFVKIKGIVAAVAALFKCLTVTSLQGAKRLEILPARHCTEWNAERVGVGMPHNPVYSSERGPMVPT